MPFYEYQCRNCGHELEAMQKVSDVPLKKCPHCGKSQLERLISAPVFRLKGGGWYETDFKDDKDKKRNLADRAESEPSKDQKSESAESKSDSATSGAEKTPEAKPVEKSSGKPSGEIKAQKNKAHGRRAASRRSPKVARHK